MENQYKKPNQLRAFFTMMKYFFLAQTRNPATFAFGFLFPVVFISIFGLIGNSTPPINIGIPIESNRDNPITQAIKEQDFAKIQEAPKAELENKIKQGKLSGILEVETLESQPPQYTINVITSQANPQEAAGVTSFVRGIADQTNLRLSGVENPPVRVTQSEISGREIRYIDFALPGQIGFSLLSTALFGTVFGLIYLKKALILKRMFATPTKALTILLAQGGSRLIVALLQTLVILILGVVVFQFYLPHGWITFFELMLLSTIGLIAFLGFGYFMAGLANDENAAGPLVNLVSLPQFLLSGTFFPTDNLPNWLQPIANNLPLSYFNMAVRKVTTEGGDISQTIPYIIGLIAWGAIMYILAAKTFRWE
ncbi:MAG: ABC transporter permease [Candidatus Levybacteria bacterium]|nr:ABC transporter permease [Candidatus Levybacteria bacterium]